MGACKLKPRKRPYSAACLPHLLYHRSTFTAALTTHHSPLTSHLSPITVVQCVLPMYHDMEDRSPARFRRALGISFSLLTLLYATFATVAYLRFGPHVPANVLNDLRHGGWGDGARVGMSVVVLCVYPLMVVPMVAPVKALIARRSSGGASGGGGAGGSISGTMIVNGVSVCIVGSVMGCTFFVSDLGTMSVICGSLSVGGFVALAPGLVGLFLSHPPGVRVGPCWRIAMIALICGGLALSALGFFFPDNYVSELARPGACWWQLGNTTT